jgi:hypothetical protein
VRSQLERFPTLDPDVSVDDILGLTFAGGSGSGGISSVALPRLSQQVNTHKSRLCL